SGFLSLRDFTPEAVQRPHIRELMTLTIMSATPPESELDPNAEFPHDLTVKLKSGDVLTISRTAPRGTLGDPFTDEDRWRKFEDCCVPVLGDDATRRLYDGFNDLAARADINDLMKMMARPSAHLAA
ncbi:MAG: MmgE/PrpD family protein, partial [Rhodospirillaceae bacterium]|nr:MmgE/PrpD family protein [Rhodospirillaceae bacterium]